MPELIKKNLGNQEGFYFTKDYINGTGTSKKTKYETQPIHRNH